MWENIRVHRPSLRNEGLRAETRGACNGEGMLVTIWPGAWQWSSTPFFVQSTIRDFLVCFHLYHHPAWMTLLSLLCSHPEGTSLLFRSDSSSQAQGDGPHLPSLISLLVDYILVGLSVLGSWRKACPDLSALWLPSLKRKGDTEAPRAHSRQEQKQNWTQLC